MTREEIEETSTYQFSEACAEMNTLLKLKMEDGYDITVDCANWEITEGQFRIALTSASEDLQGLEEADGMELHDRVALHAKNAGVEL